MCVFEYKNVYEQLIFNLVAMQQQQQGESESTSASSSVNRKCGTKWNRCLFLSLSSSRVRVRVCEYEVII